MIVWGLTPEVGLFWYRLRWHWRELRFLKKIPQCSSIFLNPQADLTIQQSRGGQNKVCLLGPLFVYFLKNLNITRYSTCRLQFARCPTSCGATPGCFTYWSAKEMEFKRHGQGLRAASKRGTRWCPSSQSPRGCRTQVRKVCGQQATSWCSALLLEKQLRVPLCWSQTPASSQDRVLSLLVLPLEGMLGKGPVTIFWQWLIAVSTDVAGRSEKPFPSAPQ